MLAIGTRTNAWSGLASKRPLFVVAWASRSSAELAGYENRRYEIIFQKNFSQLRPNTSFGKWFHIFGIHSQLTLRLSGSPELLNKEARSWRVRSKRLLDCGLITEGAFCFSHTTE